MYFIDLTYTGLSKWEGGGESRYKVPGLSGAMELPAKAGTPVRADIQFRPQSDRSPQTGLPMREKRNCTRKVAQESLQSGMY